MIIQHLCSENTLEISVQEARISEGCMGKTKGNIWQYTIDERKDGDRILIPNTSLKHMVSLLKNFKEDKESLLQSMGYLMGVIIDQSPNVAVSLHERV